MFERTPFRLFSSWERLMSCSERGEGEGHVEASGGFVSLRQEARRESFVFLVLFMASLEECVMNSLPHTSLLGVYTKQMIRP
jgi:hypothetical protein